MGKFTKIQDDVIKRFDVNLCYGELCPEGHDWHRTHAHVKERRVCKWAKKNSIQSTFTLLHEIGHIETTKSTYRRCESEYYATVWALKEARDTYNLDIPDKVIQEYQDYIEEEYNRGKRRGGSLPEYCSFILSKVE